MKETLLKHNPEPDYSDLVAVVDISQRATEINGYEVSPSTVSMWITRFVDAEDERKRIPEEETVVGGRRLFSWRKFSAWMRRNGFLNHEHGRVYDDWLFDITEEVKRKT